MATDPMLLEELPDGSDLTEKLLWQHREAALPLLLRAEAVSPAAQTLIEGLLQELIGHAAEATGLMVSDG